MSRGAEFSLAPESSTASLHSAGATIALSKVRGALTLLDFVLHDPDIRAAMRRVEQAKAHLASLQQHLLARGGRRR